MAEIGVNHNGDIKNALKMIDVAKKSAVHAIKFQTFKASELVSDKMKKNSIYVGIDWFSTEHQDYSNFIKKLDMYSRTEYSKGPFVNVGTVNFTNKLHLVKLFKKFEILVLEHKVVTKEIPEKNKSASWNFVAKKIS
jgi:cell fate (sporulation/competence/biofilm development) regulator YmcA (YheA/YmcA/DUF963 family)